MATELCTHVHGVDAANDKFLSELPGDSVTYESQDYHRDAGNGVPPECIALHS